VLFGLMALILPSITLIVLVALFGAYVLVDGVIALGTAIFGDRSTTGRRGWLVVEGIAGIVTGILTFAWPGVTALVLLWLLAGWALVTSVLEIVAAVRPRREIQGEWLLALSGALSVLFGILLVAWPAAGALTVVFLIGAYAIVFGAVHVGLGLRHRQPEPDTDPGSAGQLPGARDVRGLATKSMRDGMILGAGTGCGQPSSAGCCSPPPRATTSPSPAG
jgi:uncharacterized membrane protein HdeD (DUF308 family)